VIPHNHEKNRERDDEHTRPGKSIHLTADDQRADQPREKNHDAQPGNAVARDTQRNQSSFQARDLLRDGALARGARCLYF
jgi:hypothetical protein